MTISARLDVIERLLDHDNLERFALFESTGEGIHVTFYERNRSRSFAEWLGLNEDEIFLREGGHNHASIDIGGIAARVHLDDDQLLRLQAGEMGARLENNTLILDRLIQRIGLRDFASGRKHYSEGRVWLDAARIRRSGLAAHHADYEGLAKRLDLWGCQLTDLEYEVVADDGQGERRSFRKPPSDVKVLYAGPFRKRRHIALGTTYVETLVNRLSACEPTRVYLAALTARPPSIIGPLEILNDVGPTDHLREVLAFLEDAADSSPSLYKAVMAFVLSIIAEQNSGNAVGHLLGALRDGLLECVEPVPHIPVNEHELVELKSRDKLAQKDTKIIEWLAGDICRELATHPAKLYAFGVEDGGKVEPLSVSRFPSDRLGTIESGLREYLEHHAVHLFPVPAGTGKMVLLVLASRQRSRSDGGVHASVRRAVSIEHLTAEAFRRSPARRTRRNL